MDLSSADNLGAFGEVVQTNITTISFSVGDIVFYNISDGTAIRYSGDGTIYVVINEDKILFKEGSPL
jgi:co-chaperonin GroES (HSP10)